MRYAKILFLTIVIFTSFFIAAPVHAKGNFIKIEYFTPASFTPENAETSVLSFFVIKNSNITVRIFNFSGAIIFEKKLGFFYAGKYEFVWDGLNQQGKPVTHGFYKCEIIASQYNYVESDKDYAVVLVNKFIPGTINAFDKVMSNLESFPIKITGFVRSITEADSKGIFNWDKKEVQIDLRGKQDSDWKYDLRFFPYHDPSVAFNWSDFVEARAGYYKDYWNIEAGYHNFIPGYDDPLNLFQDYTMPSDRLSVFSNIDALENKNFNINGAFHRIISLDQYALQAKSSFRFIDGSSISGCSLNKFSESYKNNVLGFWMNYPDEKGIATKIEIAGSSTSSESGTLDQQIYGGAIRGELGYDFPFISEDYGNFSMLVALEMVEKNFFCDFAELPNGNDNYGPELTLGYNKNFDMDWFNSVKVEVKKTYFRSIDNLTIRQKFKPTATATFIKGLDFSGYYDYLGIETTDGVNIAPLSRKRLASGEIHYYKPKTGGWDSYLSYATSKTATTSDSLTDYTSTKFSVGYHFVNLFFPYLGCEKRVEITGARPENNFISDCYFWTLGANWIIWPKYKTKTTVQAGWVQDNMDSIDDRFTYYADFQQYFFDHLSVLVAYGSLTSINPAPVFSMQVKYEF